ncbi:hypothetical protein OsI_25881 [Oryza sativa Indica Group]|uniref:EXPERA domain-containing protein n=1 Tax=Oryza sativa subsp. indica TaxID=39946 RepID=A2YKZ1_ORYSI|nr:hypothetical protein OsI_25881 [Oryza sativa Indica Group]
MGLLSTAADAAVVLFSLAVAAAAPLIDAQAVLPRRLFPAPHVRLHRWYATEFGDYLAAEPPGFFRGLVWLELVLHWPLSVATLYGVLARRPWAGATALAAGVSVVTAMGNLVMNLDFNRFSLQYSGTGLAPAPSSQKKKRP